MVSTGHPKLAVPTTVMVLASALLASLLLSTGAPVSAQDDIAVELVSKSADVTFSPNGDSYEDELSVAFELTRPATVSVTVETIDGAVVRTLLDDLPDTEVIDIVWGGEDETGQVAPEAAYHVVLRATDSQGRVLLETVRTAIDQRLPGAIAVPLNGSAQTGTFIAEFVPTPGFQITQIYYESSVYTFFVDDSLFMTERDDGVWVGPLADTGDVDPNRTHYVYLEVRWIDPR